MTAMGDIAISTRLAAMTVPVAVYFLVLGLLHTRRRPQMLTGRADFALLIATLGPLVLLPAMSSLGGSPVPAIVLAIALAVGILLFSPAGKSWVVYNISPYAARDAVAAALRKVGIGFTPMAEGFALDAERATIKVEAFPLLHNATIRLVGGDGRLAQTFHAAFADRLALVECQTSAMAVSMLLAAMVLLAAPLALMAQDVPQIVRILTDLLY